MGGRGFPSLASVKRFWGGEDDFVRGEWGVGGGGGGPRIKKKGSPILLRHDTRYGWKKLANFLEFRTVIIQSSKILEAKGLHKLLEEVTYWVWKKPTP